MVCTNYGKGFFMRLLCTNISSHPNDIWELIKPKSWRGGEGGLFWFCFYVYKAVFNIDSFSQKMNETPVCQLVLCKQKSWQITNFVNFFDHGMKLKIPDEMLSHLVDFLRHTLNNFCLVFNSKVVMWNFLYKR